jgi:hypothetical protein
VKHFSTTEWADYVRGVAPEKQCEQMQEHLEEGCKPCNETVQMWRSVTQYASQEISYQPPTSSLRIVESYFAPYQMASKQITGAQIARLTFDSFASGIQAGFRSSGSSARQLMYQFDDVFIDLRLEPQPATHQVGIVGQIADSGQSSGRVEGADVSLMRGQDRLLQTSTNEFGEFHFTIPSSELLQLLVGLKGTTIVVSLPGPEEED